MRVTILRAFTFVALALTLAAPAAAQQSQPSRSSPRATYAEPEIRTRIENLLASANTLVATDYYHIEMRSGPSVRLDAIVVTVVETQAHMRGLRVQVRDDDKSKQIEATTYLDLDEVEAFSRALAMMSDLAGKWTGRDERRATDLTFGTTGGLRLTLYQSSYQLGRIPKAYLSAGVTDSATMAIEVAELPTLKQAVDQALVLLRAKTDF